MTVTLSIQRSAAPFQLAASAFAITGANAAMFAIASGGTCANSQTLNVEIVHRQRDLHADHGRRREECRPRTALHDAVSADDRPVPDGQCHVHADADDRDVGDLADFASTPISSTRLQRRPCPLTNTGSTALNFTSFTAGGA